MSFKLQSYYNQFQVSLIEAEMELSEMSKSEMEMILREALGCLQPEVAQSVAGNARSRAQGLLQELLQKT
jgi:hypothetical protein